MDLAKALVAMGVRDELRAIENIARAVASTPRATPLPRPPTEQLQLLQAMKDTDTTTFMERKTRLVKALANIGVVEELDAIVHMVEALVAYDAHRMARLEIELEATKMQLREAIRLAAVVPSPQPALPIMCPLPLV